MRPVLVLLLAVLAVLATAGPAAAHASGGDATTFRSEVVAVDPPVDGITVRVLGGDAFLEVVADGVVVEVPGYEGEPYLVLDGDGVRRNVNSPATYVNTDRFGDVTVPARASATATPEWEHVADEPRWAWHDHRIHWMAATDPPAVKEQPGQRVQVLEWAVPVVVDGTPVEIQGTLEHIPPPSGWLVAAGGLVLVAGLVAVGLRVPPHAAVRAGAVGALVLGLAVAARGVDDVLGLPAALGGVAEGLAIPVVAALLALAGGHRAWRADPTGAAGIGWLAVAAVGLVGFGLSQAAVLRASHVLGSVPVTAVQALVLAALAAPALPAALWLRHRRRDEVGTAAAEAQLAAEVS